MRLRFDGFALDPDRRQLFPGDVEVHLQPRVFDLLLRSRPKALSKQHIREQLWPATVVGEASLTVAAAELRSALGDDAKEPRFVRTVYSFGYAFAARWSLRGRAARLAAGALLGLALLGLVG